MPKKILIFGFGYVGKFLAHHLIQSGWQVWASTRQKNAIPFLKNLTFFDFEDTSKGSHLLKTCPYVLSTIVPCPDGNDPVLELYRSDFLNADNRHQWLGYLSSTSVYGDHQGNWVTEESVTNPKTEMGIKRLKAEKEWHTLWEQEKQPVHIFRLSGIYGLGRSAFDRIGTDQEKPVVKPNHLFSRIHIEDIIAVLYKSLLNPDPGNIYNMADDEPALSLDVLNYARGLIKQPPLEGIPYHQANLSSRAKQFYADNKKGDNTKIKKKLGVSLEYPTYREGLQQIHSLMFKEN